MILTYISNTIKQLWQKISFHNTLGKIRTKTCTNHVNQPSIFKTHITNIHLMHFVSLNTKFY